MIIVTFISFLLHFSVALNDYNYVLERYTIHPTTNYILKSKLCRIFKSLSMCDDYKQNRNNWHRITPTILEYNPSIIQRRHVFINKWNNNDNTANCVCKCCTCPQPRKSKSRNLFRNRRNYENSILLRKNKFNVQNKHYYMVPLVRKKYENMQKRRKRHHVKRFNMGDLVNSVKCNAKNTYEKAGKGFDVVKNTAVNAYQDTCKTAERSYNYVKDTAVNTYQKAEDTYDNVKDSAVNTYDKVRDKVKTVAGIEILTPAQECIKFLNEVNTNLEKLYHDNIVVQWNYESNLTEENKNISIQFDIKLATKLKENSDKVKKFDKDYNCSSINQTSCRQINVLTKLQESALSSEDYKELQNILRSMEAIFSTAVIKDFKDDSCLLHLEPGITNRMAHSRDPVELEYLWESWRNETGRKLKMFYPRYIELMNRSAILNGFDNVVSMWLSVYEQENFEDKVYNVWEEIKPLYEQLHAYVRYKLKRYYGTEIVPNHYIPAHLIGNVFGQTWINIYNLTMPFPDHNFPDITTQLQSHGYTPLKMFEEAEKFFKSLGLPRMTDAFWNSSILELRPNVQMVCHASAWDMQNKKDFRIKMCSHVTYEDFIVIHHEMGHVEYYMLYKDLPIVFREGANPGFHEAVGDTIALSVSTPDHIKSLGLNLDNKTTSHENEINFLFLMALQKLAFLPYALVVESWRWGVFKGNINLENYNQQWWDLRTKYQGIQSPKPRSEDNFDAGGKYHIAAGVPYIRYFVSFVIQFQFHEALCKKAGKLNDMPLHKCDIYKSQEAGQLLKEALSLGKSVPWSEIMYKLTGSDDMSASSLLKYFEPLNQWLNEENAKKNIKIGWDNKD